jgi:AraC-like ligand binding domain
VKVKDQEHRLDVGDVLLAPKGVPHTYRVESAEGGCALTITVRGDFERFVRAVGRPAERPELPEPAAARHRPKPLRRSRPPPPNMESNSSDHHSNNMTPQ